MEIEELIGKTLLSVTNNDDEIIFVTDDNEQYKMFHSQDCCESVYVEDVIGDLNDLVGSPILKASVDTNCDTNPDGVTKKYQDSFTWTFYNLVTINGHVTIRWYGESNGYYSERVDFEKIN